jgi:hypothetical protein
MVEKYTDIEATVADVIRVHTDIPRDRLPPEAVTYYEMMGRGAPISGEITRFMLTEANRGTPVADVIHALVELISVNLSNMIVNGAESSPGDAYPDNAHHSAVHKLVDEFSDLLHRNLATHMGIINEDDGHVVVSEEISFRLKEVGDA